MRILITGAAGMIGRKLLARLAAEGTLAGKRIAVLGLTYKPKSRQRRRWGHRQHYTTVEITGISAKG